MTTKRNPKTKIPTQPTRLNSQPEAEQPIIVETVEVVETEKVEVKPAPRYKILSEKNSLQTLQTEVERHLSEGWSLQGGVSVAMYSSPYETVTVFSQSLTKNI